MVPPGEGNEARGDGRRGVGVSQSTAEAGELSPRDPVEGRGHRQVAPLEWKWQGEKGPCGNVKRTPLSRRVPINAFSSVERGPSGSVGRP